MAAKIRIKCPHCGAVTNISMGTRLCLACKKPVEFSFDSCVYLYRQGSPYGVAGGFGIYVNGVAYGHIGNKETLCIPLPYGTYTLHCAVGMSRKCQDLTVVLSADTPKAYAKTYIKPGFWANSFAIIPIEPALIAGELLEGYSGDSVQCADVSVENVTTAEPEAEVKFELATEEKTETDLSKCVKCGSALVDNARFCFVCGEKIVLQEDTVVCPMCSKKVAKANFCPVCGHKFETKCPECGAKLAEGARFCAQCGKKL